MSAMNAIKGDLEKIILSQKKQVHERDMHAKRAQAVAPNGPAEQVNKKKNILRTKPESPTNKAADADEKPEGIRQSKKYVEPSEEQKLLNRAVAEAAAKEFKQKEKKIQKACAKLDNAIEEPKETGCSCIIL